MTMFYQELSGQKSTHNMISCVCVHACGGGGGSHNDGWKFKLSRIGQDVPHLKGLTMSNTIKHTKTG
jgi:hypothetical protein